MNRTLTTSMTVAMLSAAMFAPVLSTTQSANAAQRVTATKLAGTDSRVVRAVHRAMPKIASARGRNTAQGGPSDTELDLTCSNDWFIFWVEDADGNPIMGTITLHCAGEDHPVG